MTDQLDDLRSQVTNEQRAVLDTVLVHYQEHNGAEWVRTRVLHHRFCTSGKSLVRTALKELGGGVVYEQGHGPDAFYGLTFLGILLTSQGQAAEGLLVGYLEYVRDRFSSDPELRVVRRAEVESALGLTVQQSTFLKELIKLGNFWNGSAQFVDDWQAGIPNDVEDFQSVKDFRPYVRERALKDFDASVPIGETERSQYFSRQHQQRAAQVDATETSPREVGVNMGYEAIVLEVLIASPSDVERERKAITDVIYSWNTLNARERRVVLLPVMWETHSTPEMGDSPQAILNKQFVKDCDILVGTFWTRIGTPTGMAESGTVEEIEHFIETGKPVLLYFSSVPVDPNRIDDEQHRRLKAFREKCRTRGLYAEYASVDELREKLSRHLTASIRSRTITRRNRDEAGS